MKRNNKKGFTIVELVIVIAVIAILAAVLIPTFSGIVTKAKENAALQEIRNEFTTVYAIAISDDGVISDDDDDASIGMTTAPTANEGHTITTTKYVFTFGPDGILDKAEENVTAPAKPAFNYTVDTVKGVVTVAKTNK